MAPGQDVVAQLRARLSDDWQADLLAEDGASTRDVAAQLERDQTNAGWLIVSAGGNDALEQEDLLDRPVRSVGDALDELAQVRIKFRQDYRMMLDLVLTRGVPVAVCTIYDPLFPEPRRRISVTALTSFNDIITREAFARRLPLIDLRVICDNEQDFANPIEPSVHGGAKIASAIASLVTAADYTGRRSVVVT